MMTPEEFNQKRQRKGLVIGIAFISIGILWILRKSDLGLPDWIFGWEVILIAIGFFAGLDNRFRNPGPWIMMGIGGFFLIEDMIYIPFNIREYIWPVAVILIGLLILFRPKKSGGGFNSARHRFKQYSDNPGSETPEETIDAAHFIESVSIFNGLKKIILSKNFKGGSTTTVFGGTEINLIQADFQKSITIDNVVVFGGLKLIVPPHWEVRMNMTSLAAGVEDKRHAVAQASAEEKILILTGTVLFGGIDVVSY